jgi:hypothetical protein
LQLAALLRRWPATHCSLQRSSGALQPRAGRRNVAAMASNALDLAALLRCLTALQLRTTLRCSVFVFVFVFFLPDNLKREKEWEKERSFDTCSLVSRLRLSLLWLVVRNVKLLVGCKKRKAPSNNTSSNSSNALLPTATTQEFQKHKKSVAFNMKQQGIEFF